MVEEKKACGTWESLRGWSGSASELCLKDLWFSLNEARVSVCLSNLISSADVGSDHLMTLGRHHPTTSCATALQRGSDSGAACKLLVVQKLWFHQLCKRRGC